MKKSYPASLKWAVVFLAGAGLLAAACAKPAPSPSPTTPTTPAIDAKALYTANCLACHGDKRQGIQGLGLPLTPAALAAKSTGELRDTVTDGRPNTAMVGFKGRLTPEQIDALVNYIKTVAP